MFGPKSKPAVATTAVADAPPIDAGDRSALEEILAERREKRRAQAAADAEERRRQSPMITPEQLRAQQADTQTALDDNDPTVAAAHVASICRTIAAHFTELARTPNVCPQTLANIKGFFSQERDRLLMTSRGLGGQYLQERCAREAFAEGSRLRKLWGG